MSVWEAIVAEARDDLSVFLVGLFILTLVLVRTVAQREKVRLKALVSFTTLHLVGLPIAAALRASGSPAYRDVRLPCLIAEAVAAAGMIGILIFNVGLPRVRVRVPRILQDLVVGVASLIAIASL